MVETKQLNVRIPKVYHDAFKRYALDHETCMQDVTAELIGKMLLENGRIEKLV